MQQEGLEEETRRAERALCETFTLRGLTFDEMPVAQQGRIGVEVHRAFFDAAQPQGSSQAAIRGDAVVGADGRHGEKAAVGVPRSVVRHCRGVRRRLVVGAARYTAPHQTTGHDARSFRTPGVLWNSRAMPKKLFCPAFPARDESCCDVIVFEWSFSFRVRRSGAQRASEHLLSPGGRFRNFLHPSTRSNRGHLGHVLCSRREQRLKNFEINLIHTEVIFVSYKFVICYQPIKVFMEMQN